MARPKVKINLDDIEKLYAMQCTDEEAAAFTGISTRTLSRRRQSNKKLAEAIERGKAKGRMSVRRSLFRMAGNGNVAAAIFLAKNLLGYRDIVSNEHSGPDGSPIQLANKPDFSQVSDDELKKLRDVAEKALNPKRD